MNCIQCNAYSHECYVANPPTKMGLQVRQITDCSFHICAAQQQPRLDWSFDTLHSPHTEYIYPLASMVEDCLIWSD